MDNIKAYFSAPMTGQLNAGFSSFTTGTHNTANLEKVVARFLRTVWEDNILANDEDKTIRITSYSFFSPLMLLELRRIAQLGTYTIKIVIDEKTNNRGAYYERIINREEDPDSPGVCADSYAGIELDYVNDEALVNLAAEFSNITLHRVNISAAYPGFYGGRTNPLMHNKFITLGKTAVLTGSYNFNIGAAKHQDNNLVMIRSPLLTAEYVNYFESFVPNGSSTGTLTNKYIAIGPNVKVRPLFTPYGPTTSRMDIVRFIRALINSAQVDGCYMCMYTYTRLDVYNDLYNLARRAGTDVKIIVDNYQGSVLSSPVAGISYKFFNRPEMGQGYIMHHKYILLRRNGVWDTVITGSQNMTRTGNILNYENMLVIEDSRPRTEGNIPILYHINFMNMWNEGE